MNWKRLLIPHPLCFAELPILLFFNLNEITLAPSTILIDPLLLSGAASVVLYLCLAGIWKNPEKAALTSTIASFAFYALTYVALLQLALEKVNYGSRELVVPIVIAGYLALLFAQFMVVTTKKELTKLTGFLNQIAVVIMIFELGLIAYHEAVFHLLWIPRSESALCAPDIVQAINRKVGRQDGSPDIYFIVLDCMASPRVLRSYFDYDNGSFVTALESRGFRVMENSHSNYPKTLLSLSSILNMSYLDGLATICGADTRDWTLLFHTVNNHAVGRILKKHGYTIVQLDSGFPPTNFNRQADVNHLITHLGDFKIKMLHTTLLGLLPQTSEAINQELRRQRLVEFEQLAQAVDIPGPKFVFAHFLLPHEPFLFDAEGKPVDRAQMRVGERWSEETAIGYRDQAVFAEKKALEAIDVILHKSSRRPIIILQGDHGSSLSQPVSTHRPSNAFLAERFGILNAYLLPESASRSLYSSITPVNSFRIIINELFNESLSTLPDRIMYSPYPYPYKFADETRRVAEADAQVFAKPFSRGSNGPPCP